MVREVVSMKTRRESMTGKIIEKEMGRKSIILMREKERKRVKLHEMSSLCWII